MQLLSMGTTTLAECAVGDRIWDIGLAMTDAHRLDRTQHRGHNLLSCALMAVRDRLS